MQKPAQNHFTHRCKRCFFVVFATMWCVFILVDSHAQAQQNRMQLNLRDVSLSNSLEMLVDRLGKNLLLDAAVPELKLNMSLENITPMEAFLAILEANGLAYKTLKGGVFYVAPAEKIGRSMELRSITCKYAKAPDLEKILKNEYPELFM